MKKIRIQTLGQFCSQAALPAAASPVDCYQKPAFSFCFSRIRDKISFIVNALR